MTPLEKLRKHVSGKIESGQAVAIVEISPKKTNMKNNTWEILKASRSEFNESNGKEMEGCIADGGNVIAYFPTLSAMRKSNLIAAAPELLAALQELLADKYLADPINADRMAKARAAISKATGH